MCSNEQDDYDYDDSYFLVVVKLASFIANFAVFNLVLVISPPWTTPNFL